MPFDPEEAFGRVRAPVRVTANGHSFRTTLARYGGVDYVGFNRGVREAAGITDGDRVTLEIELDDRPRAVEIPGELEAALAEDASARATFEALSPSHRREYATWVAEARRPETRARRVEETLARLRGPG